MAGIVLSLSLGRSAHAEPPASEGAEVASSPAVGADLVQLKDGSLFRGTIAELVRGDHVVIVTISGEARRFPISEVAYAGRADERPSERSRSEPSEAPPPDEPPATAVVRFESSDEGKTILHVTSYISSSAPPVNSFQPDQAICVAPCVTKLPLGRYRFGVSQDRGHVERLPTVFHIAGPVSLRGIYEDRSELRGAGWGLLVVSSVVGTLLVALGRAKNKDDLALGGIIGGLTGVTVGLALGLQFDSAEVTATRSANTGKAR